LEIGGRIFAFMVDTGAMISLIQPGVSKVQVQPCDVQAMGVTGTQLEIIGEQKVEFTLRHKDEAMTFVHTVIVSPLTRCSSGILGMDFLQQVGAEISLTTQLLHIGHCSFPLSGQERGVSTFRRLANAEAGGPPNPDQEGRGDEPWMAGQVP
jgi:hypothetical protein